MTKELTIIAAASINNVIGNNNKLIWHIPKDLIRFKELTSKNIILSYAAYSILYILVVSFSIPVASTVFVRIVLTTSV